MNREALCSGLMILTLGLASTLAGCSDDQEDGPSETAGASAATATGGKGGAGGAGKAGNGTSSSAGRSGSGSAGRAGTPAAGGGGTSSTPAGGLTFTCTEEPPKEAVKCGGQDCTAPSELSMNPCIIPCCVQQGGKEMCGSRSAADMLTTQCVLPAKPAPECPDVDSQNGPLEGCCNAEQKKCGVISTLRPGCVTESQFVMIGNQACGSSSAEDAGVEPDAG